MIACVKEGWRGGERVAEGGAPATKILSVVARTSCGCAWEGRCTW